MSQIKTQTPIKYYNFEKIFIESVLKNDYFLVIFCFDSYTKPKSTN
jgi:hypothetical protein